MTSSRLAPPPAEVKRRDSVPPPAPPRAGPGRGAGGRDRAPYERVLGWALLASVVVHSVLLLLTGDFIEVRSFSSSRSVPASEPFAGLEWVVPVPEGAEGDSPPAAAADQPDQSPPQIPSVLRVRPGESSRPEPSPAAPAAQGAPSGRGSARDALRPGYRDPRLYVDVKGLGVKGEEQSAHEQYMEHIQARIDAINDSVGAVAAREKAAKDWTFRDKSGKRWGVSEEGVHLGGVTVPRELVPVPRATGDNQSIERAREEQRQRDEIRRQEETRERRDTLQQRSRAIRERKSGGGGPPGGG